MPFFLGDLLHCPVGNLYLICSNDGMRWWICVRFYHTLWSEFECVNRNPMRYDVWEMERDGAFSWMAEAIVVANKFNFVLLFDWKWNGASCRWHIQSLDRETICLLARTLCSHVCRMPYFYAHGMPVCLESFPQFCIESAHREREWMK